MKTIELNSITKRDPTEVNFTPMGSSDVVKISINIIRKFVATPTAKGELPSDRDCLRVIALCKAQRLNPFERDVYVVGYDGKHGPEFSIIVSHNAYLKRAVDDKNYDGMESGIIVDRDGELVYVAGEVCAEGCKLIGGWAKVFLKNRSHPEFTTVRLAAFRKDNRFWNENPHGMIRKCAEKDVLGMAFPNVVGAMAAAELNPVEMLSDVSESTQDGQEVKQTAPREYVMEPTRTIAEGARADVDRPAIELAMTQSGVTWDQFKTVAVELGHIPPTYESWADIPTDVSKRLSRIGSVLVQAVREHETIPTTK